MPVDIVLDDRQFAAVGIARMRAELLQQAFSETVLDQQGPDGGGTGSAGERGRSEHRVEQIPHPVMELRLRLPESARRVASDHLFGKGQRADGHGQRDAVPVESRTHAAVPFLQQRQQITDLRRFPSG